MGAENFYPDVAAVAEAAGVTAVKVPALEMTGCNWHPSIQDHRVMADLIEAALKKAGALSFTSARAQAAAKSFSAVLASLPGP